MGQGHFSRRADCYRREPITPTETDTDIHDDRSCRYSGGSLFGLGPAGRTPASAAARCLKVELGVLEISNISPVQALLLTAIDGEVSVRDLTRRAYHLGSSISYNLKKLTEHGYVSQAPSPHDKRSVHVSLTEKGVELGERLRARDLLLAQRIFEGEQGASDLQVALGVLRQLEQRWYEHVEAGGAV